MTKKRALEVMKEYYLCAKTEYEKSFVKYGVVKDMKDAFEIAIVALEQYEMKE